MYTFFFFSQKRDNTLSTQKAICGLCTFIFKKDPEQGKMSISKHCSHVPPGGCWCALKPKNHLVKIKVLPPLLPCGSTFYAAVKASCTSKDICIRIYSAPTLQPFLVQSAVISCADLILIICMILSMSSVVERVLYGRERASPKSVRTIHVPYLLVHDFLCLHRNCVLALLPRDTS